MSSPTHRAEILIGTSGWHYKSWRGPFFPQDVKIKDHLAYYAAQFRTTELNGVFYRTPTVEAVTAWRDQTPADFVFAWKASKFITHWKRLSERSQNSLELLESRLSLLGEKAGPVLFQLPPQFEIDHERLAAFCRCSTRGGGTPSSFAIQAGMRRQFSVCLSEKNIALCISDHADAPSPWRRTADFVYIRGHGPGGRYKGHYSAAALARLAAEDRAMARAWPRRLRLFRQ